MREEEFRDYLKQLGLAESTINTRSYALKRVEKAQGIDLDEEAERDHLSSVIRLFKQLPTGHLPRELVYSNLGFSPRNAPKAFSWYRSHLRSYRDFALSSAAPIASFDLEPDASVEEEAEADLSFGLEKDLQTALRTNIQQLEAGLEIIDGGVERHVSSGFVDILARDRDGVVVVIELKAGMSQPKAVAQVLGYMGAIAEEMQLDRVRGLLIAADHHKQVIWAARAVPNLSLKSYGFQFSFVDH